MKKIGIFTFHNVPNYGAVLQAYSLKEYLEKILNREVCIIDFQCQGNDSSFEVKEIENKIENSDDFIIKKWIKLQLFRMFAKKEYSEKLKKFCAFRRKYLNIDSKLDSLKNDYELFVCGSDQIWNLNITNGFQDYYFGANENQRDVKTISYAASCGNIEEVYANERQFFQLLGKLYKISVREKSLNNYLVENNIESKCTVDPTFLLSKGEYVNNFSLSKNDEKYILVYELQQNKKMRDVASRVARLLNLPVICISGYMPRSKHKKNEMFAASPEEFLDLFYNAEYIVTNSFHGLAFSLIFEKNFNVVMPKSRGSRLVDLLKKTGLENRIYHEENMHTEDINYIEVNELLQEYIEDSKEYLSNIVREINDGAV